MENPAELSLGQIAALDRSITPPRMSTYLSAAAGDTRLARELYLWDRAVSVGFLADLAILEVALRNAMSAQLERKWGAEWYANREIPLDDRSSSALNTAWRRISGPKTPGKLVAQGPEDESAERPEDERQRESGEGQRHTPFAGEERIGDVDRHVGVHAVVEPFDGVAQRGPSDGALESAFVLRRHPAHVDAVRGGNLLVARGLAQVSQPPDCHRVRCRTLWVSPN